MKFLVTNDDGIFAPGIQTVVDVLQHFGTVYVVCPDKERSAVSHAITLRKPIRAREVNIFGRNVKAWAVDGTPADCVKLALDVFIEEEIDYVVSGMNLGANVGRDIFYSGTISAAMEATQYGIPAIAVSLDYYDIETVQFADAKKMFYDWMQLLKQTTIQEPIILNVNIPYCASHQSRGFILARLDLSLKRYQHVAMKNPNQQEIYWLTDFRKELRPTDQKSDYYLLNAQFITVSLLTPNFAFHSTTNEDLEQLIQQYRVVHLGGNKQC